jgi:hypothetical protein
MVDRDEHGKTRRRGRPALQNSSDKRRQKTALRINLAKGAGIRQADGILRFLFDLNAVEAAADPLRLAYQSDIRIRTTKTGISDNPIRYVNKITVTRE